MNIDSDVLDVDSDFEDANEYLYREGVTDGLPVIPPTRERVERMLEGTNREPGEVVGSIPPKHGNATIEKIAINAVMAGCNPAYMPVLASAVEAMTEEQFNLYGVNATTHPVAPMLVINGPIVDDLKINYGYNVFGQGWKANATIGRAIRLLLVNVGGGQPGGMDRATHGHPGKYSYCIAENAGKHPWEPLHVQRGYDEDQSTVTVFGAEAPQEINDHVSEDAQGVLTVTADVLATIGNNNAYYTQGELVVVFGPEHAETIERGGFSLQEVQRYLYDQARNRMETLRQGGMYGIHDWPERFRVKDGQDRIPLVEKPGRINVLVAGGAGKHSMAIHSFGETRSVTKPIEGV